MSSTHPFPKGPPPYTGTSDINPSTSTPSDAGIIPTRSRTHSRHEFQPLPAYVRNRDNDEEYISALRAWAEEKKYVTPGQDGTFVDLSMAMGVKSVALGGLTTATPDRTVEKKDDKPDDDQKGKRPGRLRRLSRVLMGKGSEEAN